MALRRQLQTVLMKKTNLSRSSQPLDFKLPLTTPQQLLELENKIENATDLEDLVNILSHVGGDTVKKNVHFIMKKLMNKELSLQYSAKGKKKKDFSKLSVYKAVLEAVKVNFFDATDLEITRCIGVSLATAGDRDGGRQLRAEKPKPR
ncbi:hypothetical protein NQ318_006011 [Aromia moschata]|uniref:DUF4806 domain-containing protein n=1 Tax=Aromia moschata TaxID=1265417 RepID=A0AAV8Y221_9CUCU|nr:hypothetical protein NQ318_006011 [Aromia moschata]